MLELKVDGMTCGGCVKSVTNALKALDPKAEVNVDLEKKIVKVESTKNKEEIVLAIEDAGYDVL